MILPACTDVEKKPTFRKEVGVDDELVKVEVAEGRVGGRREMGKGHDQSD